MCKTLSPSFEVHQRWIEDIISTPESPPDHVSPHSNSLTEVESPSEHVLRGSKSWAARSYRSRTSGTSLRVPSNKENRSTIDENSRQSSGNHIPLSAPALPILGEIAPNGQLLRPTGPWKFGRSPTPSLKKKKAEAIVKAHGSPQHIRVTAGGRIVPSEQSPLCHPRYGYSAIKANGGLVKFAPNHPMGKAQWTQATQNGFVAQDVNGRLCQIVNGTILPLNEIDGALRLFLPAPNLNISSHGSSFGPLAPERVGSTGHQQRAASISKPAASASADPPLPAQTNALELEYSKLEHELKELDKTEALHGRTMTKTAKDALVGKRRELVSTMDNIRKAIKSIKSAQQAEAPLSPRVMHNQQQSISSPPNRLPAFLQQRPPQPNEASAPHFPANFNQFFGMPQPQLPGNHFGGQATTPSDAPFNPAYAMPPLFVPPPAFDGSMAPAYPAFPEPPVGGDITAAQRVQAYGAATKVDEASTAGQLPQNDGARSVADLKKVASPRQSRAVDIKAPVPKPATAFKSNLNPMSPAYKPGAGFLKAAANGDRPAPKSVKDRAPTPLSPLHQLRPSSTAIKASLASEDTSSPTKKSPHLHSSSVSSFETVDFFPRDTKEYSTRKYAYLDQSEDKENTAPPQSSTEASAAVPPTTPLSDLANGASSKVAPASGFKAPAPPPGTPVTVNLSTAKAQRSIQHTASSTDSRHFDFAILPDRLAHNVSPKSKRQNFVFVEEHPSEFTDQTSSSSPEKLHQCREELCATASPVGQIDFTEASRDWIEGYREGLARRPVGSDRQEDYLDGYCAGLLKSKHANLGPSTGSPTKPPPRRPSPGIAPSRSSSRLQLDRHEAVTARPPFEKALQSMDTLKEAVFAPNNENAILTPSAEGPSANELTFNLGTWAKDKEQAGAFEGRPTNNGAPPSGFPFPSRTSSVMQRQTNSSDRELAATQRITSMGSVVNKPPQSSTPTATTVGSAGSNSSNAGENRVSSMTSIDSNLYRQWPGCRVFSPHLEWKSASSIAQAAGLATGHMTNAESEDTGKAIEPQRIVSFTSEKMTHHSRFQEGSLDGITNPPNSPQPISPPMSPTLSAINSPGKTSKRSSPAKGTSPAKVKFEHIAEKVGIKVTTGGKKEDGSSPSSPNGKRNWRNVWRGGSRKDSSQDEGSVAQAN
ncbi:uncharacterized protein LTR77_009056 [Saxophila tyrrhenica]|uniref:Uncharacterized protein n=1 Tax=Saxophila tyrrhenica TaxID=1690608 RepID=A0AAV9P3K2_9PEZI|nr:hypothetical protein LTR77_009056 [Saxophila tyrrhenica]